MQHPFEQTLFHSNDVFISFVEIKKGRSVKSLRFKIRENLNTKEVPAIERGETDEALSDLEKEFLKMEEMRLRIN